MAKANIAQAFDSVKTVSERNHCKNRQYLEGFSKADYDPNHYDMSGQLRSALKKVILSGTNEQACTKAKEARWMG